MKWNELSIAEKAKYIKLGVDSGITDLNTIREAYNKFDEGGPKEDELSWYEKDTWKPWYWGIDTYEAPTLQEAIVKAYKDGKEGENIMYKDKAYKVAITNKDFPLLSDMSIEKSSSKDNLFPFEHEGKTYYRTLDNKYYSADSIGSQVEDPNNDLLYSYYNTVVKSMPDSLLPQFYTNNYRELQKRRRASAREQDIPEGGPTITLTKGNSAGVAVPTALIDSVEKHTPKGTVYHHLGIYSQETALGKNQNFRQDRGFALASNNNERFELPDQTYYSGISSAIRQWKDNHPNKLSPQDKKMTEEDFVKKYLDINTLKSNPEMLKFVSKRLRGDITYGRFKAFTKKDLEPAPNLYKHTWEQYLLGYNEGDPNYEKKIEKRSKELKENKVLVDYLNSNKFGGGGSKNYTPATLAGYITQLFTDNETAAKADIVSSIINTGADAVPVVGNILGALISVGDTAYDAVKLLLNPSWSNLGDLGSSATGIIPGIGSVKDVKNISKATAQIVDNVKTTKSIKVIPKSYTRGHSKTRMNVLSPNGTIERSYSLDIPAHPYFKLYGTIGNSLDTVEDTYSGIDYLLKN